MGNEIPASRNSDEVRTSDQGMRREHPDGGAEGNATPTKKQRTFRDVYMLQGRIGEPLIKSPPPFGLSSSFRFCVSELCVLLSAALEYCNSLQPIYLYL